VIRVAGEIGQYALGAAEGRLGVDYEGALPLTLWASAVAAGIVGDAGEPAIVAALDMTAERRRAAGCDRSDHAPLDAPEMSGVRSFVSIAVAAKYVG
jgi:hypothetical protein